MVNQVDQSMSSALESAAMDMESTSKSASEPIGVQPTINNTNGSAAYSNGSTNMNQTQSYSGDTMSEDTATSTTEQNGETKPTTNVSAVYGDYDDYQLLPEAPWPPPVFIRQDITPQERYYIEHRWYSQWSFFDTKATENKNRYYRTQLIVGIGSVSVPVLVGINATGLAAQVLYFVTVFISLSVAMATAIESLYTFGDNWRSYRSAAEDMRQEKSLYDVKAGRYASNKQAFIRFVERCEEIIAQQNGRWVQSQEKAAEQIAEDADALLNKGKEADDTDRYGNHLQASATYTAPATQAYVAPVVTETYAEPIAPATPTETYAEAPASPPPAETYADAPTPPTETYTETPAETYTEVTPVSEDYAGMDTEDPMGPTSYG